MAPGQVPPHTVLWREAHSFHLLSPLMGFLSRAWGRLRGPGPLAPWLAGAGTGAEAKAPLAAPHVPWGRHLQGEIEHSGASEQVGETAHEPCLDPKASTSPPETWGLSGDGEEYSEEEGNSVPSRWGRKFTAGQPAPRSPSLQCPDKNPGEENAEEEGVTKLSYPWSYWEWGPAVEEQEDGEAVEKAAPAASATRLPGSKPSTGVSCPGEEEDRATEEKRTENKAAGELSISTSVSVCQPGAWECCSGEAPGQEGGAGRVTEANPSPEPDHSLPAHRPLLRACEYSGEAAGAEGPSIPSTSATLGAWACRLGDDTEEDEGDEDSGSESAEEEGEAEAASPTPATSAFLKAWVYCPGEDTEDEGEDKDSDWGPAEEEGEGEPASPTPATSAFLKAWVYCPGEDTEDEGEDEDSDWGPAEKEGEAEAASPTPTTSAFLKAWVYCPGEDTEDDDECEDEGDSEADEGGLCPPAEARGVLLRDCDCGEGEETQEEAAEERGGNACCLPVAIYLPGERPPPPWVAPKLPLRLQRRLRLSEAPTQDLEPQTPPKATKVRFSEDVTVHLLAVWAGPAQAARRGPWEQLARDRSRFARRIARAQEELGPCLSPASRARALARLQNSPASLGPASTPTSPAPAPPCGTPAPGADLSGRRG